MQVLRHLSLILLLLLLAGCGLFAVNANDSQPLPLVTATPLPATPVKLMPEVHVAYIADSNGKLYLCNIESNNQLTNCGVTGTDDESTVPEWLPENVAFYSGNMVHYAYVASSTNIFVCVVNADNNLSRCHTTGSGADQAQMSWMPAEVKLFAESNISYAYVTAVKTVYRCNIMSDGNLNNCMPTGTAPNQTPIVWLPNGITFNAIKGHNYAYITAAKSLFQCEIGSNGNLINCHPTGVDSATDKIHWHPSNIAFNPQPGGGFYAYVAEPNHVFACNVDNNGSILNCNPTGTDASGRGLHWLANKVVFDTVNNKKHAYVSGVYNIYLCDVAGFALTNCGITGSTPDKAGLAWNPKNIILN